MDEKELRKQLSVAIDEKKLVVGLERTLKILRKGNAALVAIASNCPEKEEVKRLAGKAGTGVFECKQNNLELGELCRKTFRVSSLTIVKQVSK